MEYKFTKKSLIRDLEKQQQKFIKCNIKNYQLYLDGINDCINAFFLIFYKLKCRSGSKQIAYFSTYLVGIINNYLVIKDLLKKGLEIQLHTILRTQFEHLNIILSLILNEDFLDQFTYKESNPPILPITPKQKHCSKILKKYFSEKLEKKDYAEWKERLDDLYDHFSKATHGNLTQVFISSITFNDDDSIDYNFAGSNDISDRTFGLLKELGIYSFAIWSALIEEAGKKEIIDYEYFKEGPTNFT